MEKKRTMNELRQTKEYQNAQKQIDDLSKKWPSKYASPEAQEAAKQMAEIDPSKYDGDIHQERALDPIFEAKNLIVDKITKHFQDIMFEMVCEEMNDNDLFRVDNYLTPAGYDQFEDEWFEFYHEHHGDILYEVLKNITN